MCLNIKLIESFLDTAYTQRLQVIENQSLYTSTLQQLTVSRQQLELQRREIETSIQRHNDLLQLRQQQQISVNRFPISELRNRKEQLRLQRERLLQEITLTEKLDKTRQELRKRQDKLQQQQQNLQALKVRLTEYKKEIEIAENTRPYATLWNKPDYRFQKMSFDSGPNWKKIPLARYVAANPTLMRHIIPWPTACSKHSKKKSDSMKQHIIG